MKTHDGACHCGAVRFRVEADLADPVVCNCSFCVKRGALLQKVQSRQFSLIAGESTLSQYGSREFSDHFFCKECGIHCFTRSTRNNEDAVVVNLACLAGVDLEALTPRVFDGARLL